MAVPFYIPDQNKLNKAHQMGAKNITIPVDESLVKSTFCWELIAKAFCDALKQYYLQSLSSSSGSVRISFQYKPYEKFKKAK